MSGVEGLSNSLFQPAISFLLAANTAGLVRILMRSNSENLLTNATGRSPFIRYDNCIFCPAIGILKVIIGLKGVHVTLFCVCMFVLARNRNSKQWFIGISAVIMFVLSTADVAITIQLLAHDLVGLFDPSKQPEIIKRAGYKNPIFVTNK